MRRIFLLLLAFIVSFIIIELFTYYVIGYPKYVPGSYKYIINNKLGQYNILTVHSPRYTTSNVEGGYKVIQLNNCGLPGLDINIDNNNKNIILLGDSFVEAFQYDADLTSAGILQKRLQLLDPNYQIINLGASGHDPYVLWHRMNYYEKKYKPYLVILVWESFERLNYYLSRWNIEDMDYNVPVPYVRINDTSFKLLIDNVREKSAFINIGSSLLKNMKRHSELTNGNEQIVYYDSYKTTYDKLCSILLKYKYQYGNKFIFVSIMRDCPYEADLKKYCEENKIAYYQDINIMKSINLINGSGHFNKDGNRQLGFLLYDICSYNIY